MRLLKALSLVNEVVEGGDHETVIRRLLAHDPDAAGRIVVMLTVTALAQELGCVFPWQGPTLKPEIADDVRLLHRCWQETHTQDTQARSSSG